MWHPHDNATVLTASADGSMRLWDVNYIGDSYLGSFIRGAQKAVIKPQLARPGRVQVACPKP
jgi:WD40 repeat protein